jgi:hypothetical protein
MYDVMITTCMLISACISTYIRDLNSAIFNPGRSSKYIIGDAAIPPLRTLSGIWSEFFQSIEMLLLPMGLVGLGATACRQDPGTTTGRIVSVWGHLPIAEIKLK